MTTQTRRGFWYSLSEAASILNGLGPKDVRIERQGDGSFVWAVKQLGTEMRLDVIRTNFVNSQVGYSKPDDRWFDEEERQPLVSDRLEAKFGDPNILRNYGVEGANTLWEKDPNVINSLLARRR